MGANLSLQIVNGLSGDPAVYASIPQLGEAVLFDAGVLDTLSQRDLLKVRTVCISHTHVDHFIGFDRLLRVNVPHFRTLEIIGPVGICRNVCGKIAGYTWNLLEPDQLNFVIHEVARSGEINTYTVTNTNGFVPVERSPSSQTSRIPLTHNRYQIDCVVLDHGTDVCAFALRLPGTLTVSQSALDALGITPGPWIGELQKRALSGDLTGLITTAPGQELPAKTLADQLLTPKSGESVAYVTDILFSEENLQRMVHTLSDVDTLVCEANYREEHQDRAFKKSHLTTKQAALIGASIHAKNLEIFHISGIYGESEQESVNESQRFWEALQAGGALLLTQFVNEEFQGYARFLK